MNIHSALKFKFHFTNEQPSVLLRGRELAVAKLIWIPNFYFRLISSLNLCKSPGWKQRWFSLGSEQYMTKQEMVMANMIYLELVICTQEVRVGTNLHGGFQLLKSLEYFKFLSCMVLSSLFYCLIIK